MTSVVSCRTVDVVGVGLAICCRGEPRGGWLVRTNDCDQLPGGGTKKQGNFKGSRLYSYVLPNTMIR